MSLPDFMSLRLVGYARYFNVGDKSMSDDDLKKSYDALMGCVGAKPWRQCTQFATLWLNETIATPSAVVEAAPASRATA